MDDKEFKEFARKTIDWIINYRKTIKSRNPISEEKPGYLAEIISETPPEKPEKFDAIFKDFDRLIMKGVTHWNHPQFHGYFAAGNAYTNILGDALNAAIGPICFSWIACPAATELETIVVDWFAKAMHLPDRFITDRSEFVGGGCFQGSASEATLLAAFAARHRTIKALRKVGQDVHDSVYLPQLVVYASKEAHSSVQKACQMALIRLRTLDTDNYGALHAEAVELAMQEDIKAGLTPCMVVVTLGTTGLVAFDDLKGIATKVRQMDLEIPLWIHVDAAYAGNALILEENRHWAAGLEMADSFMVNPNKLMLGAFDMTCMYVANVKEYKESLVIDPAYLVNNYDHKRQIDYRHYSVPLSRRFRALKLWFLMRSYGVQGLRNYVSNITKMAGYFKELVEKDPRFEVFEKQHLGLVVFRFKCQQRVGDENANMEATNDLIHELIRNQIYLIPTKFKEKFWMRLSVNYEFTTKEDIDKSWKIIRAVADTLEKPRRSSMPPLPFSFVRKVPKEVYERQKNHLSDGCTPIFILDEGDNPCFPENDRLSQSDERTHL